jgi:demethylmenaquinone methyltransferase/2-methoxy-6-polyprenyl-1,4-benzoquinol methylase
LTHHRIDFFEKIAPYYDTLLDLLTFGLYAKFLKKAVTMLAPQKGEKILDLCSGTGRAASWMAQAVGEEGGVVGMDVAKRMVEVATNRYRRLGNLIFLQKDVTQSWGYQNHFDGIFTSFSLHEIPELNRSRVIEQSYLALKKKGRMVIADFNPEISGRSKTFLLIFFKLFERENLNFFSFGQRKVLEKVGFKRVKVFPMVGGLFQITCAQKD